MGDTDLVLDSTAASQSSLTRCRVTINFMLAVSQVLLRFLGGDEGEPSPLAPSRFSWISGTPVLEDLLHQLAATAPLDAQQNAAYILSALARSHLSPLSRLLGAPPFLSRLIECALAPDVSILVGVFSHPTAQPSC